MEFVWAAAVACLSVAAGWALWTRAIAAIPLARAAILAAMARELQSLAWTALPSDVVPGTRPLIAMIVVASGAALLAASTKAR